MGRKYDDLLLRFKTAVVLILVYGVLIYLGGVYFALALLITCVIFIIELNRLVVFRTNSFIFLVFGAALCFSSFSIWDLFNQDKRFLIFLLAVVMVTDISGYFVGKFLGGPKVSKALSPNKTWSGLFGGWVGAIIVAIFGSYLFESILFAVLIGFSLSLFSQAGDFLESYLKRRAQVKDSSNLLPGHGGFLDRFDGIIGAGFGYGFLSYVVL
ncbi:MAG: phosphatidate cytidylyltransferase [Proteobacteria bacterium]|jgi:phosphatidate cytidylyltransferase|nr:phosphatidate cytidylyltransferase [Pseudomonadota bacterium]